VKRNIFRLLLVSLLTIGVTDYLWLEIFQDQQIVADLEKEKEKEESVEEFRFQESKHDSSLTTSYSSAFSNFLDHSKFSGFVKHGAGFFPLKLHKYKIFLLLHQLRIHC
tara:strand:+ start:170 stop:496 length:327 start_codon:yes stop_codon:yes gene_type:complete